jgi:hypothetical protein
MEDALLILPAKAEAARSLAGPDVDEEAGEWGRGERSFERGVFH